MRLTKSLLSHPTLLRTFRSFWLRKETLFTTQRKTSQPGGFWWTKFAGCAPTSPLTSRMYSCTLHTTRNFSKEGRVRIFNLTIAGRSQLAPRLRHLLRAWTLKDKILFPPRGCSGQKMESSNSRILQGRKCKRLSLPLRSRLNTPIPPMKGLWKGMQRLLRNTTSRLLQEKRISSRL